MPTAVGHALLQPREATVALVPTDAAPQARVVLLEELALISEKMKTLPLPQNRAEFEDRANLFILMERLKDFLQIKRDFML